MFKSDLCEYSGPYIVVKETAELGVAENNNMKEKGVVFKNNAPFRSCISN